jgi:hypothetical protein
MGRSLSLLLILAAVATSACERAKSANPLSPDVAGPIPGVSISAPTPLDPPQGGQVVNTGSPLTLTAENATTNGQRTLYLQVQLATDVNFQTLVHHADRVELGANRNRSARATPITGACARSMVPTLVRTRSLRPSRSSIRL